MKDRMTDVKLVTVRTPVVYTLVATVKPNKYSQAKSMRYRVTMPFENAKRDQCTFEVFSARARSSNMTWCKLTTYSEAADLLWDAVHTIYKLEDA